MIESEKIARQLILSMSVDNDFMFPFTPIQLENLSEGVQIMMEDGLCFDGDVVDEISMGERGEILERFSKYNGWKKIDDTLESIFNRE